MGYKSKPQILEFLLELGQVPLSHTATKSAMKNWVRICHERNCNNLVTLSYKLNITENLAWATGIKTKLEQIGMLDVFLNQEKNASISFYQRKNDIFHQNALCNIKLLSNKLRTYSLLKTEIGYESYLSQIENVNHRTTLTKLRLSNHSLKIETGRKQRLDKNLRFCPFCPNFIEDEKHFLLQCSIYNVLRRNLFTWAGTQLHNFNYLEKTEKFVTLLTNINFTPKTASAVYKMFCIREFLIKNHKNVD